MKFATFLFCCTAAWGAERTFTVAALTLTPEPWNKAHNFAKMERYAREAAAKGAEVIVAPEGFLEGYVGNGSRTPDLVWKKYYAISEAVDGPLLGRVRSLAMELRVHLMTGFAERRGGKVFNSAVMFDPAGTVVLHYAKTHTVDDEPFNTKGAVFPVADTPLGKWGTLICFDRQVPEAARLLALHGAEVIFVPAWGGYGEMNDLMMRVRAYENGVHVVFVHPKRALLIDPKGRILEQNSGERDQVVLGKILISDGPRPGPMRYRRAELYGELAK